MYVLFLLIAVAAGISGFLIAHGSTRERRCCSSLLPAYSPGLCLLILSAPIPLAPAAASQEPKRGETVMRRERPDLTPLGVRAADFLLYPELSYTGEYDDNIFATSSDRKSDYISVIKPKVAIRSDWNNHEFKMSLGAELGRYRSFSTEDYDDWEASGATRLDIARNIQVLGLASYSRLHQPRDSFDDFGGLKPTEYTSTTAVVRYSHKLGRVSFIPEATFNRLEYDDTKAVRGGIVVNVDQSDRNRDDFAAMLRVGYAFLPDSEGYIRLRYIDRDYDKRQQFTNFERSSVGYELVGGMRYDWTGIVFFDLFLGYHNQRYNSPLPDISTPIFGASVNWNPTLLTTFNFTVERTINETIAFLFSGYTSTRGQVNVDHELRRNLLINADVSLTEDDFEGIAAAESNNDTVNAGIGITWMINRYINASLRYEYTDRDSSDNTLDPGLARDDFVRHSAFFKVSIQR